MFDILKKMYEPIRKGNEYRESVRGKPETWKEEMDRISAIRTQSKIETPRRAQSDEDRDRFRLRFEYWDTWTGARFDRVENPTVHMTEDEYKASEWSRYGPKPEVTMGTICRSDPVTGDWKVQYA